jgi:preprotein translocase subunit SecG
MITFLTVLHILVCLFLILVVLLQAGKGGGMGIAFGGGGSQTVFGSSGAGNFLTRLTSITAAIFLITSLGLAHYSSQQDSKRLQRLAERKQVEKKADDDRAAKLQQELEKARQSAPKPATPADSTKATPAPVAVPPASGEKAAPKASDKADVKPGDKTAKAKDQTGAAAGNAADKPAAPAKKKRAPDTEGVTGKPSGEKAGETAPRAPPAAPPSAPPSSE